MLWYAHSGIRYLVLLLGFAALGYAIYGLVTGRPYDRPMRVLATLFAGSLHLQILLGLSLLFTGFFQPAVTGHVLLMVFAAAAAQVVPSVMRRRPPEERSYGPHVVSVVVALGLIAAGILALGRPVFGSAARTLGM